MLAQNQLEDLIKSRQEEAEILFVNSKYDGAVYLAGYAVELSLKLVILRNGFPETDADFKVWADSRTHNLDHLLKLAGKNELREDDTFSPDFEVVRKHWSAEGRYRKIGSMTKETANVTLESVSRIIERLKG